VKRSGEIFVKEDDIGLTLQRARKLVTRILGGKRPPLGFRRDGKKLRFEKKVKSFFGHNPKWPSGVKIRI